MKPPANRIAGKYPHSVPFIPPAHFQAQLARLRRWIALLLLTSAAVLVAAVAAFVFLLDRPPQLAPEPIVKEAPPPAAAPAPQVRLLSARSLPEKAPTSPAPDLDLKQRERFLEALGGL